MVDWETRKERSEGGIRMKEEAEESVKVGVKKVVRRESGTQKVARKREGKKVARQREGARK